MSSTRCSQTVASWHLSLVESGGVCWWRETMTKCLWQEVSTLRQRQQNQHLVARSDKSVAYVTNNKRVCSTFCTTEANYWQTRSIARPLCDSRAACPITLRMNMVRNKHRYTVTNTHVTKTYTCSAAIRITAPVLLADYVTTGNGLQNGVHCGLQSLR